MSINKAESVREVVFLNVEAVSVILKEGTPVSIRLGGSLAWCSSIVYKSEGRTLCIALADKYLQEDVKPGNTICVKYVNQYFIYSFEGAVARVDTEHPAFLVLRMTSAEEIINNRLSPRFDVQLEASLKPDWDSKTYQATVTDISFGGAAFLCGAPLDYNEELDMDILLNQNQYIKTRGKIIRKIIKGKTAEYSMQFSNLDEDSYRALSYFFSHLEAESYRMYERYLTEIKNKKHAFR